MAACGRNGQSRQGQRRHARWRRQTAFASFDRSGQRPEPSAQRPGCDPKSRARASPSIGFCRQPSKGQAWPAVWLSAALMRISIDPALGLSPWRPSVASARPSVSGISSSISKAQVRASRQWPRFSRGADCATSVSQTTSLASLRKKISSPMACRGARQHGHQPARQAGRSDALIDNPLRRTSFEGPPRPAPWTQASSAGHRRARDLPRGQGP